MNGIVSAPCGMKEKMDCDVCGLAMNVTRDQYGPISFCGAIMRKAHQYDLFMCKHVEQDWHVQAFELQRLIKKTPSRTLKIIYEQDLIVLLANK